MKIEASMLNKYMEESKRTFFPKNTLASVDSAVDGDVSVAKFEIKAAIQSAQDGEDAPDPTSFFLTPTEAYWKEMHRIEKNKGKLQEKLAKEQQLLITQLEQKLIAKDQKLEDSKALDRTHKELDRTHKEQRLFAMKLEQQLIEKDKKLIDAHHKADFFEASLASEKLISDFRDKSAKQHETKALKLEEVLIVKDQKLTDASRKAQELTQLIRRLPTPLWSAAFDINGAKKEFARFYDITGDVNESDVVTGHNFNIYSIQQETTNIFCLLMSDVQRKEVIDAMAHAFENGEGKMRDSYKTLFQRYSRSVEYAHNRQRQDHQAKKVAKNRETWVVRLTAYFNHVVKERFDKIEVLPVGGAGGAAGGAGGAGDGAADGAAGGAGGAVAGAGGAAAGAADGAAGDECACCGRVPPEECMLYEK